MKKGTRLQNFGGSTSLRVLILHKSSNNISAYYAQIVGGSIGKGWDLALTGLTIMHQLEVPIKFLCLASRRVTGNKTKTEGLKLDKLGLRFIIDK